MEGRQPIVVMLMGVLAAAFACNAVIGIDHFRDCDGAECSDAPFEATTDAPIDVDAAAPPDTSCAADVDASDPENCGACGHSCLGAPCAHGKCVPTTLVANATGVGARALVVDATNVYFLSNYQLMYCPISGCGQNAIVFTGSSGYALPALTQSGSTLFYTRWRYDDGGTTGDIDMIDKSNVGQQGIVIGQAVTPGAIMPCNSAVCFIDHGTSPNTISYCPGGQGCGVPTLITQSAWMNDATLAWDGANVIFADNSALYSAPFTGSAPIPLTQRTNVTSVAYDSGHLYWFEKGLQPNDMAAMACTLPNCDATVTTLVRPAGTVVSNRVAVDSTTMYWTVDNDPYGAILACGKTGCQGTAKAIASEQPLPGAIAVDDKRVYWTNENASVSTASIMWVAK